MNSGFAPINALAHLFFPQHCCGCGTDLLADDAFFCLHCFATLPYTFFEFIAGNPVEKIFYGRVGIEAAAALFYFTEGSAVQESLHRFKYSGVRKIGKQFGGMMGERIKSSARFSGCTAVVPLPLHASRFRKRGYNQAAVLGENLATVLGLPLISDNLVRRRAAGSQTSKDRIGRWVQIQESFRLQNPAALAGRHLLLVDDVITTGSTLEAAARTLLAVPGVKLSIATAACSVQV